jgi:hypothetical protein
MKAQEELAAQKTRQKEEILVQEFLQQFFNSAADAEALRLQRRVRLAHMWARQLHATARSASDFIPDTRTGIVELGWHRIDGTATCDFCVKPVKLYFFSCPLGGAAACGDCKYKFAHGYETANGEVVGKRKGEEKKAGKAGAKKGKGKGKAKK